jgi:hypothetical protein
VVVRSIQTGDAHTEYTPIGHTANLAARMQGVGPIGSIAATDQVRKLCEGYFLSNGLGPTKVRGVSEPVNVYEVTGLGPLRTRLQRSAGRRTRAVGAAHERRRIPPLRRSTHRRRSERLNSAREKTRDYLPKVAKAVSEMMANRSDERLPNLVMTEAQMTRSII